MNTGNHRPSDNRKTESGPGLNVPCERPEEAQWLEAFFKICPHGLMVVQQGRIITVNPAMQKILACRSEQDLIGRQFTDFVAPEYREQMMEWISAETERPPTQHRYEFEALRNDGAAFAAELVLHPTSYEQHPAYLGLLKDASEFKQVENKLRVQAAFLNSIIESLTHPLCVIDADDYTIKLLNTAGGRDQFTGTEKCYQFVHREPQPCQNPLIPCPLQELKRTKTSAIVEHIHYDASGNLRVCEVHAYPVFDENGEVVQAILYSLDITERKQMEKKLKESEERYRRLVELLPEALAVHCEGKIVYANSAAAKLLGVASAQEIVGKSIMDIAHPDFHEIAKERIRRILERNEAVEFIEEKIVRPDGEVIDVEVAAAPVIFEGKPAVQTVVRDITERKRMHADLKKAAEELRAEREELAEKNLVLRYILDHIEQEREEYKQQICQDVQQVIMPLLERLQRKTDPAYSREFAELQANLDAMLAREVDKFRERYVTLTPREQEICDMIKEGLSSKEISDALNISLLTVHKHRQDIRKNLGITNQNVNLATYLRTR
jgi:PAS domain S-box-containing protein